MLIGASVLIHVIVFESVQETHPPFDICFQV